MKKVINFIKTVSMVCLVLFAISCFTTTAKASETDDVTQESVQDQEDSIQLYYVDPVQIVLLDPSNDEEVGYVELYLDYSYSDGEWVEVNGIMCNAYIYWDYGYISLDVDPEHYKYNGDSNAYGMRKITLTNELNNCSRTFCYYVWVDYYGEIDVEIN